MDLPFPFRAAIERGIEALLTLDPDTRSRLAALDGKVIAINVTSPALGVVVSIVDGQVFLPGSVDSAADTTLTGSLNALRSLAGGNDALYRGDVTIEGDIGVGQQLKELLADLDPDWEEFLSPLLGDTVVHRAGIVTSAVGDWMQRTQNALRQNTADYLQEEVELLAPVSQVRAFCLDVDELRASADRLDARIKKIEEARNKPSGEGVC